MSSKKMFLVVNPYSGTAKARTELLKIVRTFSDEGYDVTVYPTKARKDATEKVATLKKGEYDIITVCGGDGTLNETISGYMEAKIDCPIGYIPLGTLNEWSSSIGIAKNTSRAAKDILSGRQAIIDIGKFDDKYFTYTASFGAFTQASYSAPQEVKNVLGQVAYLFEGIKSVSAIKPIYMKLTCDDRVIEGDFLFGAVSNSMSVGGIVKFAENDVQLDDGEFEVLLIRNFDSILKLQNVLDGIVKRELDRDGLEFFRTKKLIVETKNPLSWTLDGEYAESKDRIVIENLKQAIPLIIPKNSKAKI